MKHIVIIGLIMKLYFSHFFCIGLFSCLLSVCQINNELLYIYRYLIIRLFEKCILSFFPLEQASVLGDFRNFGTFSGLLNSVKYSCEDIL